MADLSKWVDSKHYGRPYYTLIVHFGDEESAIKFMDEHRSVLFDMRTPQFRNTVYVVAKLLKEEVNKISLDSLKNNPKAMKIIFHRE